MVRFHYVPDNEWANFIEEKNMTPWYSVGGLFLPGAFTHTDGDGVPDEQDTVWMSRSVYLALLRDEKWAWDLIIHEVMHNMVPSWETAKADGWTVARWEDAQRRLSHPKTAIAAILHSISTGHKTNSFTRLLRWFEGPHPEYEKARTIIAKAVSTASIQSWSNPV